MWWEHGASFQPSPKISRMLITRLICIQWKFATLSIEVLLIKIFFFFFFRLHKWLLVPKQSTLSRDGIRGQTRSGKALNLSFLRKSSAASVTQRFLFPVSTESARNAWEHNRRTKYEGKKKTGLQIMSLAAYASETNKSVYPENSALSSILWSRLWAACCEAFSHEVTAAILVFQKNEMAAMLVYQEILGGVRLFSLM